MTEKKITKKEILTTLRATVEGTDMVGEIPAEVVLEFIDKTIAQIDAKAEKAKERAAEKRADGDALRAEVLAAVTDEFQTADAITATIGKEDVSKSKVIARLTQLVKSEEVIKDNIKTDNGKRMVYKRA